MFLCPSGAVTIIPHRVHGFRCAPPAATTLCPLRGSRGRARRRPLPFAGHGGRARHRPLPFAGQRAGGRVSGWSWAVATGSLNVGGMDCEELDDLGMFGPGGAVGCGRGWSVARAVGPAARNPWDRDRISFPAPAGRRMAASAHAREEHVRCVPLPLRGSDNNPASSPRVPLRSTRGYSPLPLTGQQKPGAARSATVCGARRPGAAQTATVCGAAEAGRGTDRYRLRGSRGRAWHSPLPFAGHGGRARYSPLPFVGQQRPGVV